VRQIGEDMSAAGFGHRGGERPWNSDTGVASAQRIQPVDEIVAELRADGTLAEILAGPATDGTTSGVPDAFRPLQEARGRESGFRTSRR
jgi:hypothetical protein